MLVCSVLSFVIYNFVSRGIYTGHGDTHCEQRKEISKHNAILTNATVFPIMNRVLVSHDTCIYTSDDQACNTADRILWSESESESEPTHLYQLIPGSRMKQTRDRQGLARSLSGLDLVQLDLWDTIWS
jgi:hypothetical protein